MRYVIIGNGVAGTEAALEIRKNDEKGDITIISKEKHNFYSRPRLIDLLGKRVEEEKIIRYGDEFYDQKNIDVLLDKKVVDVEDKKVITEDKKEYKYDKLLLATGASPFIPDMPGKDLDGVFTIRRIECVEDIHDYLDGQEEIVVVGGGLLGIEAAYSLSELGKKVTVVEFFDRLLPKQLDHQGAKVLQDILEDKGLKFKLDSQVNEIIGDSKVNSVKLKEGEKIECKSVIFSIGVRPNLGLPKKLGLKCDKGVIVDEYMETSKDGIFAAGDVIQYDGICYGLWNPAQVQGKVAGGNMVKKKECYEKVPLESRLKIVGVPVFSGGEIESEDAKVIRKKDNDTYEKYLIKDDKLIGAIIIGDNRKGFLASQILEGKKGLEELDIDD